MLTSERGTRGLEEGALNPVGIFRDTIGFEL